MCCPYMTPFDRVDELSGDPQLVTRTLEAALQHILDSQFLSGLLNLHSFFLVCEGGVSSDYKQLGHPGEGSDDGLSESIDHELLTGIRCHIRKGQDAN